MKKIYLTILLALVASVGMSWADTYVTITQNDFPESGHSFTKDGVTVSVVSIDRWSGYLSGGGSFSTTLGNFTHIEVMAGDVEELGEGWSGDDVSQIWSGNASSVSFSGDISSFGQGITLLFTIGDPAPTYTVAGSSTAVFGTSWDESNAANDMVYDSGDGLYHFTKNNVELAAGSISFKVVKNHAWSEAYPGSDYVLAIAEAGIHNITITFNASTHAVNASDELVTPVVILPTVKVAGSFITGGWGANAVVLTPAQDNLTASGSVVLPAEGSFEMKVVVADDWKTVSDLENWITRVNNADVFSVSGGNDNCLSSNLHSSFRACILFNNLLAAGCSAYKC